MLVGYLNMSRCVFPFDFDCSTRLIFSHPHPDYWEIKSSKQSKESGLSLNRHQNILSTLFRNAFWEQRPTSKKKNQNVPTKRWGHTTVIFEKFMILFGGHSDQ